MGGDLKDQLLRSGLVDEKQARRSEKEQRAKRRKRKGGKGGPDPDADARREEVEAQRRAKAEQDRERNRAQQAEKARRSAQAQIDDLLRSHALSTREGSVRYHFTRDARVRHLEVTPEQQRRLGQGELAIAEHRGRYHVVPAAILERLLERDPELFSVRADPAAEDDDPLYAEFPVPDDLDW